MDYIIQKQKIALAKEHVHPLFLQLVLRKKVKLLLKI